MTERARIIRPMRLADYEEVAALWRATEGLGDVESREEFEAYLLRNPEFSPVVQQDDCVVGAMFSGHDGRRGFLSHLAVAEPLRRQGVARQMIEWALERLRQVPVQRVSVHVYVQNTDAIRFWRSVKCLEANWRDRDDLHVLAFDITQPDELL